MEQADGWAASLQLAAIAGRSQGAQRGGDMRGVRAKVQVLDYVLHEVRPQRTLRWSRP